MRIINEISVQRFSLDGIEHLKNFLSRVYGNKITIYNAYDSKDILIENELYTNVEVDGDIYGSASLLQQALLNVIYTRNSLGGIVVDSPYFNYFNNIEGFDLAGQDLTIYANWAWTIQGGAHTNLSDVVINIPLATSGYHRIDIVVANQNDTFELIQGVEVLLANTAAEPPTPIGALKATSLNVTDGTVSTGDTPITGTDFVKKTYALNYSYSTGTTNAVYALRENGASVYTLTNVGLVSVSGFDFSLIVGSAEIPYQGKSIRILNQTGSDITLKHFDDTNAEIPFYLKEGIDLVMPNNETIEFYYSSTELTEVFKSWTVSSETILQNLGVWVKFNQAASNAYPFTGGIINSGTIQGSKTANVNEYSNAYITFNAANGVNNSGARFTDGNSFPTTPFKGVTFFGIICPIVTTNLSAILGMPASTSLTTINESTTQGIWFNITGNQIQAKCAYATVVSTAPPVAITAGEWLLCMIEVIDNDAINKKVRFKVKKIDGTVVYNEDITSNIQPYNIFSNTSSTGVRAVLNASPVGNTDILGLQALGFWMNKPAFLNNF